MKAERKEDSAHERRQNRLRKGTYGYCLRCGRRIPEGRLAAMPAELCVPCQEEEETRPASRRPVEEQRL